MVNFSLINEAWGGSNIETFSQDNESNFSDSLFDSSSTEINTKKHLKKKMSYKDIKNLLMRCQKYKQQIINLQNKISKSNVVEYFSEAFTKDNRQVLVMILIAICVLIFMNLLKNLFK